MSKMHVKTGDTVMVITGKDRGVKAKVLMAIPDRHRVIVDGVGMVTRHRKPSGHNTEGGRIDMPSSIDTSNVLLYCSKCDKGVRTGIKVENNKKLRYCRKCNEVLD